MRGNWIFPSTDGGEVQGLNNTGIEQFSDNAIRSLAREICQNSLDAVDTYPVVVEFNTFEMKRTDFPNFDEFELILNKCLDFKKNNKDANDFFTNAIKVFSKDKIQCLRISDFSTTGLDEKNWKVLVEESGESNKDDDKSGSKGIGKHAPFACSSLRTVFYSSMDKYNDCRSKGVARLTSHILKEYEDGYNDISQGTGYFGFRENRTIEHFSELVNLDPGFTRKSTGTDVFITGFSEGISSETLYNIQAEVIDGFLMAIWDGKLEIIVNGVKIDKQSLRDEQLKRNLSKYLNKTTLLNMDMLNAEDLTWSELPVMIGGENVGSLLVAVQIKEEDAKGINKISMVRSSGMKIFDKDGLCPLFRFTGVCLIQGKELNAHLRKLENASHNKWSPQRYQKEISTKLLSDIYDILTTYLKSQASSVQDEEVDIDGAAEYLPDVDQDNGNQRKIKSIGFSTISEIKIKQNTKVISNSHLETKEEGDDLKGLVEEQGSIDEEGEDFEAKIKEGSSHGHNGEKDDTQVGKDGSGDSTLSRQKNVKSKQIRIFTVDNTNKKYKLIFYPTEDSNQGFLEINMVAENDEKSRINILRYEYDGYLRIQGNKIGPFNFVKDEKTSLILDLDVNEYFTMEVKLYAYKG